MHGKLTANKITVFANGSVIGHIESLDGVKIRGISDETYENKKNHTNKKAGKRK